MNSLLLEIGTEEIPAGYIQPALEALSSTLLKKLADARIDRLGNCIVMEGEMEFQKKYKAT